MHIVLKFLSTALVYTLALLIVANPSVWTVVPAAFFSLVFCLALFPFEMAFPKRRWTAFISANVFLIVLVTALSLITARLGNFSATFAGVPTWISGVPTAKGFVGVLLGLGFYVLCNFFGILLFDVLMRFVTRKTT